MNSRNLDKSADLDAPSLSRWLKENVSGFGDLDRCEKFPGGRSNPTYRIDSPTASCVLRRKPFGVLLPSAHAIEREFEIITALSGVGFTVPQARAFCPDDAVIGAPFYVMDLVSGDIFWDGALPEMSPDSRRAIYHELLDKLAALHLVDYGHAGLAGLERPGSYLARQISRWTTQYRLSQTDNIPEVEQLIEWLPKTMPSQRRSALVHGDYRIDNVIFGHGTRRITAVLDWELAAIGDPIADLSYFLLNWFTGTGDGAIEDLPRSGDGIPSVADLLHRYGMATGQPEFDGLNWYFAFCRFRQLGICQGIKKRVLEGDASAVDAESVSGQVTSLARSGWVFANLHAMETTSR